MPDRILIVDEVATNRIILRVKLASASYDIVQACDFESALAAVREHAPDLVLLSDRIGDGRGGETGGGEDSGSVAEMCRRLAASRPGAPLPVVVLGCDPGREGRLALLRAGAADHVIRPFDAGTLLARIRSLLRQQRGILPPGIVPPGMALPEVALPGFGEPPVAALAAPPPIGIIAAEPKHALRWKAALAPLVPNRVVIYRPHNIFEALRAGPLPGVFVIAAEDGNFADLRLIAELRAHPETESAPAIVVAGAGGLSAERQIMALDLGAGDILADGFDPDEVALRVQTHLRLRSRHESRHRHLVEGLRLAATDPLTGILNRRGAFARLEELNNKALQDGRGYALMILDIDHFKRVNDTYGHAAGDAVLADVARRLREDMRGIDVLGRIGGEEFLVALPDTDLAEARLAAERLRAVIEATPFEPRPGVRVYLTLSIGLCVGPGICETVRDLCDCADQALYGAKALGRNTVTVGQIVA